MNNKSFHQDMIVKYGISIKLSNLNIHTLEIENSMLIFENARQQVDLHYVRFNDVR